jgi:signal transduction histidine kinase/ActR/RegA family two-component response regulator
MTMGKSSIRTRIYGGFTVVLVLLAMELAVAIRGLERIRELRAETEEVVDPPAEAAADLEESVLYRAIAVRNLVASGDERFRGEYADGVERGRRLVAELRRARLDEAGTAAVEGIAEAAAEHVRETASFLAVLDGASASGAATGTAALAAAERRLASVRERLLGRVHAFEEAQRDRQRLAAERATALRRDVAGSLVATALLVAVALWVTAVLTVRAVRAPALELVRAARAVEGGDYAAVVALGAGPEAGGSELRQLARAFGRMAGVLCRREERLAAEGRLGASLAATLDPREASAAALREVVAYGGAATGAVYAVEGELLVRTASHADGGPEVLPREGIVAEALAAGRPVVVNGIPEDLPFAVRLGVGDVRPRSVAAVPLTARGGRVGVVVLASLGELDEDGASFATAAADQLAVALQNGLAHQRLGVLADELQATNERLQAQNEELQAQGEEIQAQAEELHAQAEDIRRQNDDLSAAKEAIAEKAAALEEVDRRKDEFLATLGHELRNPLAAVATAGQLLEAAAPDGPAARHSAIVTRQTGHLRRLVDDLLDLSRINHGKIELRRAVVDLRALLAHAVEVAGEAAAAKSQRIALRAGERPAPVDADAARVEQVLSNLLQNAVRYTPEGGTIIAAVGVEGDEAVVRVGDTGMGIPHDLLPRIFEPFIQGTHSEAGENGLGLGLALVRRLVELHGGTVVARSDGVGQGTEFVIRLPLAAKPAAVEPSPSPALPQRRADGDMRLHVLVVEDNPDVAETTADALELFGYSVRVAPDAEAGLRAFLEQPPDVGLLDIGLPGRSGLDLARDVRARLGETVRLVAVTGYGQPEDRARAEEAGFDAHLVKPVDLDELRAVIERLAFSGAVGAAA